jgi:hypothetical protein
MRIFMMVAIVSILAVASSCVRMPEKYAYALDRAATTNEKLIEKIEAQDMPDKQKAATYKAIILEDNKSFRAAAETIRNGGGD